jgi:carbamate kinase
MKKKVVIALGHRALGTTFPEQKIAVKKSAKILAEMVAEGCQLIITHSNAPQVGMIHTAMNEFGKAHQDYTAAPMSVCSAMSQGYIGYDLQNAIRSELLKKGIFKTVSTILTQVLVDPYDDAFYHPVKVIGRYMSAEEAEEEEKKGNYMIEEPGKGFRRIVAAPHPKDIIEIDAIRALTDAGQVVIACGGGGIPVLSQGSELKGASAIIEKDYVSGKLAEMLDADILMILTNDEKVCLDHLTDCPKPLAHLNVEEAERYIKDNQFGETAMLPKIQASVSFLKTGEGRRAIITNLEHALNALEGKAGTIIEA